MPLDNPQSLTQRNQIHGSVEESGWRNSVQYWHKAECVWQAELTMIATNTAYLAFSDYHVRHSALPVIALQLLFLTLYSVPAGSCRCRCSGRFL